MPAYRFPILMWQDSQGGHTACLVEDDEDIAACAASASDAKAELKRYLEWRYKQYSWLGKPDFLDPQLMMVKVEIRPEYEEEDRRFPSAQTIPLRFPCVFGRDSAGLQRGAIPTLGLRFNYHEKEKFKELVIYTVQSLLKGLAPADLMRHFPPATVWLDDVVVSVPRREPKPDEAVKTDALEAIGEPLGARGVRRRQMAKAWGREADVRQLLGMLKDGKANVLLVGESGSGKTTLLLETVRNIERSGSEPAEKTEEPTNAEELKSAAKHRFWATNAARLIAGMQYLGMWQERVEKVIAELSSIEGVLCIDNLLDLIRTGGHGPGDSLAAFLIPYLQRGEIRMIGEATPAELDACRRLMPALADQFSVVKIPPLAGAAAIAVLDKVATTLQQAQRVTVERGVIELIYRLFARFMPYESFPGKASGFLAELIEQAARQRPTDSIPTSPRAVTPSQVMERLIQRTGLPDVLLRDDLPLERWTIARALAARVIGQEVPCRTVADLVVTFKAGLNDPHRPLGVLLFCGPTGVGKTELARALSDYLFGHGSETDRMIRIDMSEYSGPGAAERLLGNRHAGPSELIRKVRRQPFHLLLLDEIEKAAPEIFDLLLGVFDEGRLTDPFGRLTTFRSAVIVMTSNLGAQRGEPFGFSRSAPSGFDSDAMDFFRPEFFNRIDAVVTFHPLEGQTIEAIVRKELRDLASREGLQRSGVKLSWTDRLVNHLAARGFDRRYGARPLQRTIESLVVTPLAKHLVAQPEWREKVITLDLDENELVVFRVG